MPNPHSEVRYPISDIRYPKSTVLPVIDLKGGCVVRGVAGRRDEYRAIQSRIAGDARPATVARGLVEQFSFNRVYVADLDAIAGFEPNWQALSDIAAVGLELLVDAGINDARRTARLAKSPVWATSVTGAIVGLESVDRPAHLPRILREIGSDRAIFSIDLMDGHPLSSATLWRDRTPRQIADMAVSAGFERLIVLDLAAVGVDGGPRAVHVCREVRAAYPRVELISGGGVTNVADLSAFRDAGCNAILVASALHDGRLSRGDVVELG